MKPMLAGTVKDTSRLVYPLVASPKLDGVRALVVDGQLMSRNGKLIPNLYAQQLFAHPAFNGLDGELIVGDPTRPDAFRVTSSAVMSSSGAPRVKFHVFDDFKADYGFYVRAKMLKKRVVDFPSNFTVVEQRFIKTEHELLEYEEACLSAGYEGVMIRTPDGPYKQGRSTDREGYLLKLKRFSDAEAKIMGYEEKMHNANDKDASGKRTSHKAGLEPMNTLGALQVRGLNGPYAGVEFNVGTGFDDELRAWIWDYCEKNLGSIIKYKFFPTGSKDAPRFPTFLGFRDPIDL